MADVETGVYKIKLNKLAEKMMLRLNAVCLSLPEGEIYPKRTTVLTNQTTKTKLFTINMTPMS